ncbi:MAG TPA: hypothetical protein VLV89_00030 [Candidatus Acidoferrum sp.]|nr:hypothetical protein [Candidatus Acidoferrum sp.]
MNTSLSRLNFRRLFFGAAVITVSAGLCIGALPAFAQDQQAPPPPTQQQAPPPGQQQAPPPDQQQAPPPDQQQAPPPNQMGQQQMGQQQQAPPPDQQQIPVPPSLNIPAGTLIRVQVNNTLSSEQNKPGDAFTATLVQPLIANGWVVARPGQLLTGRVASAKKAGHVSGQSELGVQISELTLVDGQILPIATSLVQSSGGTSYGRDAGTIIVPTGLGAIIGGAAEGGGGAAVGAGIGAAAGIIGVLVTHGRPTILPAETMLTFRIESPLSISTGNGSVAFQPVYQSDYSQQDQDAYAGQRQVVNRPAYPPYGPYAYGPYPYAYGYPYPYYYGYGPGFYPYFGFGGIFINRGPVFRGGFRGGFGGGFHGGFHGGHR